MAEPAHSALPGARAEGLVVVEELGLCGMVMLRAGLSAAAVPVRAVTGAELPGRRGMSSGQCCQVAWMSPDELLILCDHDRADALAAALGEALQGQHHLALNVSDARALFRVAGEAGALRDVLGKLTPADLGRAALPAGELRRTRLQQVAAALWFESGTEARVLCFRSVAQYVFDLLALAARADAAVGYH